MTTGHATFDHTAQEANVWLREVADHLHFEERRHAYSALRAALHALRDRMTPEGAAHFGAQLPMVIRGLFYEGWRIRGKPEKDHTIDAFCAHVAKELPPGFPQDARTVSEGVFQVIFEKLDPGESAKVVDQLPAPLRVLWPAEARRD